jgi:uncharacterized protein (DUF1778 family)
MDTINIRITKAEKAELQRVARDLGMTLSGFIREAATVRAQRILEFPKSLTTAQQEPK